MDFFQDFFLSGFSIDLPGRPDEDTGVSSPAKASQVWFLCVAQYHTTLKMSSLSALFATGILVVCYEDTQALGPSPTEQV